MNSKILIYILVMALVTYLIRVLPFLIFRRDIQNRFIRSFLYYVPYATLAAMTFPAILYSGGGIIAGAVALAVAVILAFMGKSLFTVSASACAGALIVELILWWLK